MKTWRQMGKLVELGLVRQIGTSGMSKGKSPKEGQTHAQIYEHP